MSSPMKIGLSSGLSKIYPNYPIQLGAHLVSWSAKNKNCNPLIHLCGIWSHYQSYNWACFLKLFYKKLFFHSPNHRLFGVTILSKHISQQIRSFIKNKTCWDSFHFSKTKLRTAYWIFSLYRRKIELQMSWLNNCQLLVSCLRGLISETNM